MAIAGTFFYPRHCSSRLPCAAAWFGISVRKEVAAEICTIPVLTCWPGDLHMVILFMMVMGNPAFLLLLSCAAMKGKLVANLQRVILTDLAERRMIVSLLMQAAV